MPDYRLDGRNPLGYMGVKPYDPPQMIVRKFKPTVNDVQGLALGTQWLHYNPDDPTLSVQYVLAGVQQSTATWIPLHGADTNPIWPIHSAVLGSGSATLNSTGPVSTGSVFVSNGTGADPSFGIVPNATTGQPIVSNGADTLPTFGTASVSGGGTGLDVVPQYSVLCGGISGEGPLQTVVGVGLATQVLTSNGLGTLPTWADSAAGGVGGPIAVQVFTSAGIGTYTPTPGMGSCIVEVIGGGGGGQSVDTTATNPLAGGGGGAGSYCRKLFTSADIGASQDLFIGSGGAADMPGTASTFGTIVILTAGPGAAPTISNIGGTGGIATGGDFNVGGEYGFIASQDNASIAFSGAGGASVYGAGGAGLTDISSAGSGSLSYGGGGGGAIELLAMATQAGGAGANGIIIITEYGPYGALPPVAPQTQNVIVFDTPGADTYTPSAGMFQCMVECVGGGGGGNGGAAVVTIGNTAQVFAAGNGGGGGYCKKLFDAATVGASQSLSIGNGGAGGVGVYPAGQNGFSGGNTTFGAFLSANGGNGGAGNGGTATGGDINISGESGQIVFPFNYSPPSSIQAQGVSGSGGDSFYGYGGRSLYSAALATMSSSSIPGNDGQGYGAGGTSGLLLCGKDNSPSGTGGNGTGGVIIVTEYISS